MISTDSPLMRLLGPPGPDDGTAADDAWPTGHAATDGHPAAARHAREEARRGPGTRSWPGAPVLRPWVLVVAIAGVLGAGAWVTAGGRHSGSGVAAPPVEVLATGGDAPVVTRGDEAAAGIAAPTAVASTSGSSHVTVYVAGAVASPGVVTLPAGARAVDAVTAAGGPGADADLTAINLAQPVADGDMVLVPVPGQPVAAASPSSGVVGTGGVVGGVGGAGDGTVDLNRATTGELEDLPGIGPVTAQRIVEYREQVGGFADVEELDAVPGIGPALMAELRDLVRV